LVGVSVVPAMVIFSQGRKKMTRPSLVDGSRRPMLSGLNERRVIIKKVEFVAYQNGRWRGGAEKRLENGIKEAEKKGKMA